MCVRLEPTKTKKTENVNHVMEAVHSVLVRLLIIVQLVQLT